VARQLLGEEWCLFADHPLAIPLQNAAFVGQSYYGLAACDCGMIYNSPVRSAEQFDRYYAQWSRYADGTDSLSGPPDPQTEARHRETVRLLASHLPSRQTRILDVGCLDGGLLAEFRRAGFLNLAGVDPAAKNDGRVARAGLEIRTGTLNSMPYANGSFDLLLCVHVLEHATALESLDLFRLLAPGGRIYIEVPDVTWYSAASDDLMFDLSYEHINHFCAETLERTMQRNGFRSIEMGHREYLTPASSAGIQPSVYGLFESAGESAGTIATTSAPTRSGEDSLRAYLAASERRRQRIDRQLDEFVARNGAIRVWGTGHAAFRLLGLPSLKRAEILAITDSNPLYWGKVLRGVEVAPPDRFMEQAGAIVITSALHGAAILGQLRRAHGWQGESFIPAGN
jgi:SAM-dependent methyltransferase